VIADHTSGGRMLRHPPSFAFRAPVRHALCRRRTREMRHPAAGRFESPKHGNRS